MKLTINDNWKFVKQAGNAAEAMQAEGNGFRSRIHGMPKMDKMVGMILSRNLLVYQGAY